MRKKKTYVQKSLFGEDELVSVTIKKQTNYDQYMQGAADMFLQMVGTINEAEEGKYRNQMLLRHLPRLYMQSFLKTILKDRNSLLRFLRGNKVTFQIEKDELNEKRTIQAKIDK